MADELNERATTSPRPRSSSPIRTGAFSEVPMRLPAIHIVMLLAQRRRKTGEIRIPREAQEGDYDLVVIGSPTWWLTTNMPIRSYLESSAAAKILDGKPFAAFSVSRRYWKGNMKDVRKLGEANGGRWVGQTHFLAAGGQVRSMLSWLGYMKHGEAAERVLGMKMPPPNLKPDFEQQARSFIDEVVDRASRSPSHRRALTPSMAERSRPERPGRDHRDLDGHRRRVRAAARREGIPGVRRRAARRRRRSARGSGLGRAHAGDRRHHRRGVDLGAVDTVESALVSAASSAWSTTRASSSPGRWSSSRWPISVGSWRST